jgi:hypothetical protein
MPGLAVADSPLAPVFLRRHLLHVSTIIPRVFIFQSGLSPKLDALKTIALRHSL